MRLPPFARRSRERPYRLNLHVPCPRDCDQTPTPGKQMDRNRSGGIINRIGPDVDVDVRLGADHRREIWGEMRISAAPATVLAFLTDARQMMSWLAQSAKADARPGGSSVLRISTVYGLRGPTSRYSASKGCVYLGRNRGTETRAVHCRVRPARRCQRHVTSAAISASPIRRSTCIGAAGRTRGCQN